MLSINFGLETKTNCDNHYLRIKDWLVSRINKKKIRRDLKRELLADLEELIKSEPKKLISLNKKYLLKFPKKVNKKGKLENNKIITYIFNYKEFRRKFGYELSESLKIECCPYCNKNFTSILLIKSAIDKKVFPEFDHFYSQSSFPFLTLSFYNLIPSCNVCNTHFKSKKDSTNIFHPYTVVKSNHFNFKNFPNDVASLYGSSKNITLNFNYNLSLSENKKLEASLIFFGIKEIYEQCHTDLIEKIIHKKIAFSDRYIKELQNTYKMSFEEAYTILFETHLEENKLHKKPFSKLKKDVFEDINIKSI